MNCESTHQLNQTQMKPTEIIVTSENLLAVEDAAQLLRVHRATLYRWINKGKIACVRIGTATFVPKSEVERLR